MTSLPRLSVIIHLYSPLSDAFDTVKDAEVQPVSDFFCHVNGYAASFVEHFIINNIFQAYFRFLGIINEKT